MWITEPGDVFIWRKHEKFKYFPSIPEVLVYGTSEIHGSHGTFKNTSSLNKLSNQSVILMTGYFQNRWY